MQPGRATLHPIDNLSALDMDQNIAQAAGQMTQTEEGFLCRT
jgi:hypothetical protein